MNGASPTAVLICGKICSGKSTYCETLRTERNAAVLSVDELVLPLFGEHLGAQHEIITQKAQKYLFERAAELLSLGVNIILDWGFWTAESRKFARNFFAERGFATELHYIEISADEWQRRIEKRNSTADGLNYFVNDAIAEKCDRLFQPPAEEKIDFLIQ